MHPQIPVEPPTDAFDFATGDLVKLVNSHGLKVVGVNHCGKRIHVPNPTRAEVIDRPRETPSGVPVVDVRIASGKHRGKLVECYPGVLRRMPPPMPGLASRLLDLFRRP